MAKGTRDGSWAGGGGRMRRASGGAGGMAGGEPCGLQRIRENLFEPPDQNRMGEK